MIATFSIILCLAGILGSSVAMFVLGNKTGNQDLTFGGIGPLFVFLLFFFMCLYEDGGISMLEAIYRDEKEACCVKQTQSSLIPTITTDIPAITPEIVIVAITK